MQQWDIDSHKLNLHPQRVAQWLSGETICPVYMELSLSGTCNHRCTFCTMDFMGYTSRFLDADILCARLKEMGQLGVKAVMFAGEGEPLLHRQVCRVSETAQHAGIDVAFTTNGVLLDTDTAERLLPVSSWIKVSCNAGDADDYAAIHRTQKEDFFRVMRNFAAAAELRQQRGFACTLGVQSILLPENVHNLPQLARAVREMGGDYLVVKPYTCSPQSLVSRYADLRYDNCEELALALAAEERPDFNVIFRHDAMQRWNSRERSYERCLALPFWGYVDASGKVWGCLRHIGEDAFYYGNILEQSFTEICQGQLRNTQLRHCEKHLDIDACHVTCRMELINNYLWRLQHPQAHDNFI